MNEKNMIRIILKNGFRYVGEKVSDQNGFIKIIDNKLGKPLEINRTDISIIEELV